MAKQKANEHDFSISPQEILQLKEKIVFELLHQIHMFWTLRQALWPLFEFSEQVYCTQKWQLVILCTYYLPLLAQNTIKPNQVLPHFFIGREQRIEWDDGGGSKKTFSELSVFHWYIFDMILSKNAKNAIFVTLCTIWYFCHILNNKNLKIFFQLLRQRKKCMERISWSFSYEPGDNSFEFPVKF